MPENGAKWEAMNFDNRLDDEVEYHFNVDVQILIDHSTNTISMGWCQPGSAVSELWRKDAGVWEDE